MDSTVENSSPIDVSTLIGKRYSIDQMRPLLAAHLDLSSNSVPAGIGLEIKKLLDGKQTNIIPLKDGDAAKLSVINHPTRGLSINVMHVQARLQLRDNYLGHQFSHHDKENLQRYGDMGRSVQLIDPVSGNSFKGLIGIDSDSKKMTVINTDKFPIPDKILGVTIEASAKERLKNGYSIRINSMKKDDQTFSAFVRLAASKKGFKFERIKQPTLEQIPKTQQYGTPPVHNRPNSTTPLLDSLSFTQKGIQRTTQTNPNGIEVLVIPQATNDKYVLSIKLPLVAQTLETGKLFALPIMANKTEAESLLQLSQSLDKAIGKNQPLLPVIQQMPNSIQRLLKLDLVQSLRQKPAPPNTVSGPNPKPAPVEGLKIAKPDAAEHTKQTTKAVQTKAATGPGPKSAKTAAKASSPKPEATPKKGPRH